MNRRTTWIAVAVMAAACAATAQQTNSSFASIGIDAGGAEETLGAGPVAKEIVTDSLTTLELMGLPGQSYLLLVGDYAPGWFSFGPNYSVDIAFAAADKIVADGFSYEGYPSFHIDAAGRARLTCIYDGQMFPDGFTRTAQAVIGDPTAALGVSLTSALTITVRSGRTTLVLGDTDSGVVDLVDDFVFSFFGESYSQIAVSADGFIGFAANEAGASTVADLRSGPPRIAPFFGDLDPSSSFGQGDVYVIQYKDQGAWRAHVVWSVVAAVHDVAVFHTFEATLFEDGTVEMHWPGNNPAPTQTIHVGVFPGGDIDTLMIPMDLSVAAGQYVSPGPMSAAYQPFDHGNHSGPIYPWDLFDVTLHFYPDGTFGPTSAYFVN